MKNFLKLVIAGLGLAAAAGAGAYETPTMGWSSWNTYRVNISEDIICRQADALIELGLKDVGYTYINTDDGFFGGRDAEGNLLFHQERFPNGLKPVVDHIHSLGLKAGIYSDAGHNTCGNYWDKDAAGVGVGLYEHEDRDAKLYFSDLGFDFIKIDFCGGDPKQNTEQLDLDERERYTAIRAAIDAVGREDVRINVCRWAFPGTWVHSIGSSWRIAGDIGANWASVKRIVNANRYLSAYAGEGHYNDMDMLEIGRGLSAAEERSHFGMWCIMSSPLLIGCDLTKIPASSLEMLKNTEVVAVNQDALGLQAYQVAQSGTSVELFVKDIEERFGNVRAVAFYNPTDAAAQIVFNPADVDLGGVVKVRDLFAKANLDDIAAGQTKTYTVGAHDTMLLRLEGEERLERTVYEAETAWLERYQNIGINSNQGHALCNAMAACSGGAKVGWLGNHADNWMEWRDVWSAEGGVYTLDIDYVQYQDRDIELTVNGGTPERMTLPSLEQNKVRSHQVSIVLSPGLNTIRIGNPTGWAPDIDCIRLKRDEQNTIASVNGAIDAEGKVRKVAAVNGRISLGSGESASVWSADGRRLGVASGEMSVAPGVYFLIKI